MISDGGYRPNAHALLTAGVYVAGVFDGHFSIGSMQAAHMAMRQALAAADEDFPEGPVLLFHVVGFRPQPCWLRPCVLARFSACAPAASRTHAPSSHALLPGVQAFLVAGAVAGNDPVEFVPIDGAVLVMSRFLVPFQVGIGNGQPDELCLWHRQVDELLPQLIVGEPLDVPSHGLGAVGAVVVRRPKHHDGWPPPAVEGILGHRLLRFGALRQRHHDLESLALVKAFFLADAHHGAGIGAIAALAERHLVHDGGTIYQPTHSTHIGPCEGRVVEDAAVLGFAAVQVGDGVVASEPQSFAGTVQIQAMTGFVLHLGHQDGLAFEAGRPADPVALWQACPQSRSGRAD